MKACSSSKGISYNLPVISDSDVCSAKNICASPVKNQPQILNVPTPPTPPKSPNLDRVMARNETERFIGTTTEFKSRYGEVKNPPRRVSFSDNPMIKHVPPAIELDDLCYGYAQHTGYWPKKSDVDDISELIYDLNPDANKDAERKISPEVKKPEEPKHCEELPKITRQTGKLWIKRLFDEYAASQL